MTTVTFKKPLKSGNGKTKLSPEQVREAIQRGAFTALKKSFPNGDPTFFIPSYSFNRRFPDDIKDPYANNVWVYAACNAYTVNLLQLPKVLDDIRDDEDKQMLEEHPVLSLMENPNPLMDGETFWENVALDLLLPTASTKGGQCFILAESGTGRPVNLHKGEVPAELYPFSDDFITPIVDKYEDNMLLGWKYTVPGQAKEILYKPEEVIRLFFVDPKNPLKGQAPIWAARRGIRQDQKATALNENFFDNNASLGGALMTDAELEDDVAKEIRTKFEEAYTGQDNAGRIPLLHSGVKYEMYSKSHQEMQFLEQRKFTREEVASAYRVPKFMISIYEDINYATANAAERSFWKSTLLPFDSRLLRGFNNQWIKYIEDGQYRLKSDHSKVMALQPDLTEKLEQAAKMWAMQIPVSEINRRLELQLEIEEYDWLSTYLVNFNLVPAGATTATGEEEPPPEEGGEGEEGEDEVDTIIGRIASAVDKKNQDDKFRDTYTNSVLIPDEKKFNKILNEYLREQRNMILDKVDKWAGKSIKNIKAKKPNPDDFMPGKRAENKRLRKKVRPEYQRQAEREAVALTAELGSIVEWNLNSPGMKKILTQRMIQIGGINTTTFKMARFHISQAVEQAIEEGLGIKATAKLIKKEVNKVYTGRIRSQTIARTETASIHSQTRMDVYETEGIKKIKWLTSGDELVRSIDEGAEFPHDILDGVEADIKEGFDNGETIMFPLDPSASPSNVINCRCVYRSVKEKK